MTKTFDDFGTANEVMQAIVNRVLKELKKERPDYRYANVTSIDAADNTVKVAYAEAPTAPFTVNAGTHAPAYVGQKVRVAGRNNDKYIDDIPSGVKVANDKGIPGVCTFVTLTPTVYPDSNGVNIAQVSITWQAPLSNTNGSDILDFDHYEVQTAITHPASNPITVPDPVVGGWSKSEPVYTPLSILSNLFIGDQLDVRVRMVDSSSNEGAWAYATSLVVPNSTTSPLNSTALTPSSPLCDNYVGLLRAYWDGKDSAGSYAPSNLSYVEVHWGTTTNFTPAPATLKGQLRAIGYSFYSPGTYGTQYYCKLIAVGTNGVKSNPTPNGIGAINSQVANLDIANGAVATSQLADLSITTQKLVDAAITTAKIGSQQVSTATLADAAITAAKVATGAIGTAAISFTARQIGSITTFTQSATPTGAVTGDLWIDTGNGNVIKTYNGTTWVVNNLSTTQLSGTITTAQAGFTARQIGSVTTFTQSPTPTGAIAGDLWIDTGNGNVLKTYTGTSWTVNLLATTNLSGTISVSQVGFTARQIGSITTYTQSATPTGAVAGDLWIDTGNGNLLKRYDGTSWSSQQDAAIATAQTAANTANTNAGNANTAATNAQTAATNAQTAANTAQTTANGKNAIYRQSTQPVGAKAGDTWFDTSNGNRVSVYDGTTWNVSQFQGIAVGSLDAGAITTGSLAAGRIAAGTITGTMIAGTTITAGNLAANTITAAQIAANTITSAQILANTITAAQIAANTITAAQIAATTITASQIAAGTITAVQIATGAITTTKLSVTVGGGNVISNSAFATGDLTSWGKNAGTQAVVNAASNPLVALSGTYSVKIATSSYQYMYQLMTYKANTTYTLTYYMMADVGATSSSGAGIALEGLSTGSVVIYNDGRPTSGLPTTWTRFRQTVTNGTTDSTGNMVVTGNYGGSSGTGNVYITDIQFEVGDTPSGWAPLNTELLPGTISTNMIAANAITATQIAAGTITAAQIAANTITAAQIAATTITAAQIAAGTLTAVQIAAGAITTSKLSVVVGGGNIVSDSSFDTGTFSGANGWSAISYGSPTSSSVTSDTTNVRRYGTKSAKLAQVNAGSDAFIGVLQNLVQVQPGSTYSFSVWCLGNITPQFTIQYNNNTSILYDGVPTVAPAISSTVWQRYIVTAVYPATATASQGISFQIRNRTFASGTLNLWVDDVQVQIGDVVTDWSPKASELLPGTIVATMIATNTITATQIAASTITAAQIAASTITASQIAAGTITAAQIAAGTITGTQISATTITASNIAGGTITATLMAANSIASASIQAGAITTTQLAANSVTASNIVAGAIVAGSAIIATGAIGTAQIANLAVQNAQIANGAINDAKIGTLTAGAISAGTLSAAVVLSGSISTATSGARSVIDALGYHQYNSSGTLIVDLNTNGSNIFTGSITSGSTISGSSIVGGTLQTSLSTPYIVMGTNSSDLQTIAFHDGYHTSSISSTPVGSGTTNSVFAMNGPAGSWTAGTGTYLAMLTTGVFINTGGGGVGVTGNITTSGTLTVNGTGATIAGALSTVTFTTASGALTISNAGYLNTSNSIMATGNITASGTVFAGNVSASGSVTGGGPYQNSITNTGNQPVTLNYNNQIGTGANTTSSYFLIYISGTVAAHVTSAGAFAAGSTKKIKKNIKTLKIEPDFVDRVRLVEYQLRNNPKDKTYYPGVIAEDLYKDENTRRYVSDDKETGDLLGVDYAGLALASVVSLNSKIERQIAGLQAQLDKLEKSLV